jgi:hypothetical protein
MAFQLKSLKTVVLLLFIGVAIGLIYLSIFQNDGVRISWVETTRRKLLLYNNNSQVRLNQIEKLEQTFIANYPGLSQIDILLDDISSHSTVALHLRHSCNSTEDIARILVELAPNSEPEFYPFTFPKLDNSAGQEYCIVLESETSSDTSITVQLSIGDLYPYGEATVHNLEIEPKSTTIPKIKLDNNQKRHQVFLPIIISQRLKEEVLAQDIGFRLHYNGLLLPTGQVFVSRLTANKPYIWGHGWFYGVLVIAYLVLLIGLFLVAQKTD